MRPAFSTTRSAAAFALLLLGLLLSPLIAGKGLLPPRREIYSSIWWANGDFPYMEQQIFVEKGDIDILFVGASHIWGAFDTPYIQKQLSKQLGRQAIVRTFGWGGAGEDELYLVTQDLLAHRKVSMLVFDDVYNELDTPYPLVTHSFRFGENADALAGLPLSFKTYYYFASIVGMPRNLLSLIRRNIPADLNPYKKTYWENFAIALNPKANPLNPVAGLGSMTACVGFRSTPLADRDPFVACTPQTELQPSDVCVYSSNTSAVFNFSSNTFPTMQLHFLRKFAGLAQKDGCKLVQVHIPVFAERHLPVIPESAFWPDLLQADVSMLGIPPAVLFRGLTDGDIRKLYEDPVHFNKNGHDYFSALMTPVLLQMYDTHIKTNP